MPIRYENHFPKKSGDFLQVKLRLISLSKVAKKEIISREAFPPEMVKLTSLVNISYESDVPEGPFVTFLFDRPVRYIVRENTSLNQLVVVIPKAKRLDV